MAPFTEAGTLELLQRFQSSITEFVDNSGYFDDEDEYKIDGPVLEACLALWREASEEIAEVRAPYGSDEEIKFTSQVRAILKDMFPDLDEGNDKLTHNMCNVRRELVDTLREQAQLRDEDPVIQSLEDLDLTLTEWEDFKGKLYTIAAQVTSDPHRHLNAALARLGTAINQDDRFTTAQMQIIKLVEGEAHSEPEER